MTTVAQVLSDLDRMGPLVSFPWHKQQQFALSMSTDVGVVLGGSQAGKTTVGMGIVSRLIRREGPVYRRLRNPDTRPLKIWVAPQTLEKFKSNWERRLLTHAFQGVEVDYTQSPYPVFRWHDAVTRKLAEGQPPALAAGLRNELWCKSHDQGHLSFESDVVDLVLFDEEPQDRRLYSSAKTRGTTVNGVVFFAFTPLMGMTWTHDEFYQPTVKDSYKLADRVWRRGRSITVVQMGMADNPEAVAGGGVQRILDDPGMTEAEKRTRLYGDYGYAEGLIWPSLAGLTTQSESIYLLDGLPKGPKAWTLTADPNKRHGGLLTCDDAYGNTFVVDEHYAENLPDQLHADAYKAILLRHEVSENDVLMGADPGGAGAQAILNMAAHNLFFQAVPKDAGSVAASIKLVRQALWVDPKHPHPTKTAPCVGCDWVGCKGKPGKPAVHGILGAPRLYFLRSLQSHWTDGGVPHQESRLLYEIRQYRQKPNTPPDTPIKERDDTIDPLRYKYLLRGWAPEAEDPEVIAAKEARAKLDPLSRHANEEIDELEALAMKYRPSSGVDNSQ